MYGTGVDGNLGRGLHPGKESVPASNAMPSSEFPKTRLTFDDQHHRYHLQGNGSGYHKLPTV